MTTATTAAASGTPAPAKSDRGFEYWNAVHELGTKFYEVILLQDGDKYLEIRRYGKVSHRNHGGGAASVLVHNSAYEANKSVSSIKRTKVSKTHGYTGDTATVMPEGPAKKPIYDFLAGYTNMETMLGSRAMRTYYTEKYQKQAINAFIDRFGESAAPSVVKDKPWEAPPPKVEPVRSSDWASW